MFLRTWKLNANRDAVVPGIAQRSWSLRLSAFPGWAGSEEPLEPLVEVCELAGDLQRREIPIILVVQFVQKDAKSHTVMRLYSSNPATTICSSLVARTSFSSSRLIAGKQKRRCKVPVLALHYFRHRNRRRKPVSLPMTGVIRD